MGRREREEEDEDLEVWVGLDVGFEAEADFLREEVAGLRCCCDGGCGWEGWIEDVVEGGGAERDAVDVDVGVRLWC